MNRRGFFRQLCKKCFFVTCLLFILLFAANAMADFSFYLNDPNSELLPKGDNYATVTVELTNSKNATITFKALPNYSLKNSLGVQVNSSNYSEKNSLDGWGKFNLIYNWTGELQTFSFSVTNVNDWGSASAVLTMNENSKLAAAHVVNSGYPDNTGFAAGDGLESPPAPTVPIPAAVWLFGSGLVGLAAIRKKFKM